MSGQSQETSAHGYIEINAVSVESRSVGKVYGAGNVTRVIVIVVSRAYRIPFSRFAAREMSLAGRSDIRAAFAVGESS